MVNVINALLKGITIITLKIKESVEDVIARVEEKIELFDNFIEKDVLFQLICY